MSVALALFARMYGHEREVELAADLLLATLVFVVLLVVRELARTARMSLRRETLLTVLLAELDRVKSGVGDGDVNALNVAQRALDAELAAQVRAGHFRHVPRLGQPWPGQVLPPAVRRLDGAGLNTNGSRMRAVR